MGLLFLLKWQENGAPWDRHIKEMAARKGYFELN